MGRVARWGFTAREGVEVRVLGTGLGWEWALAERWVMWCRLAVAMFRCPEKQ